MGNINLGKNTVGSCEGDRMEWQSQKLNCFSKLQISTFSESYYGRWKNTNGAHRSSGKLIFIFRGAREAGADGSWVAPLTSAVRQQVNKLQYGPSLTSRLKHCRGKKLFTKAAPPCSSGEESLGEVFLTELWTIHTLSLCKFLRTDGASPHQNRLADSTQWVHPSLLKHKNIIWGFGGSF